MRLIDADALCMHLSDWQFGSMADGKHDAEYGVINKVIDGIEKEPTADAVSVVRCKDCKHATEYSDKQFTCKWFDTLVFPDDFCSNGKRRSE